MIVKDKVVVVTGGASGIGLELCRRFTDEGARVVLSDLHEDMVASRASSMGVASVAGNVRNEEDIVHIVDFALDTFGAIDMFCSNAGIAAEATDQAPTEEWQRFFDVNLMSHVFAAKHVLPHMLERGGGYLLNTASAAGLLVEPKAAPYTVTKHAAVGFAEWLAVAYGYRGIQVSVLCPAGVVTPLIDGNASLLADAITTSQLADIVVKAIDEERFMISTHAWVLDLLKLKGEDYPAYLRAMDQARQSFSEGQGAASPTTSGQR